MGVRALAAIAKADGDDPSETPVTEDLGAALIGEQVWDLDRDRGFAIRVPGKPRGELIAGNAIVVAFDDGVDRSCGNPAAIVTRDGRMAGAPFADGADVLALAGGRLVLVPFCTDSITVYDERSARLISRSTFSGVASAVLALIDDHGVVAALSGHTDADLPWRLTWFHIPERSPPSRGETVTIPLCRSPAEQAHTRQTTP